ncbi:MAG: hypothetical protein QM831_01115 [Kofleriaceae bacterium]
MSEFHGGFFVRATPERMVEIAGALREALHVYCVERNIPLATHHVTFATRRDSPVTHVAIRGAAADGKDYAFFHNTQHGVGSWLAMAGATDVFAYYYENQAGSEAVWHYGPNGHEISAEQVSWDDVDTDDLPLTKLSFELDVPRDLLDMVLAYDTPSVSVPLTGPCEVAAYFGGKLLGIGTSIDASGDEVMKQTLYFPAPMLHEIQALADKLHVTFGSIAWAAWEAAKRDMHRTIAVVNAVDDAPEEFTVAEIPHPNLHLDVPKSGPALPKLDSDATKSSAKLGMPEQTLREIQDFATSRDRSLSWVVQKAYLLTRDRLHVATNS